MRLLTVLFFHFLIQDQPTQLVGGLTLRSEPAIPPFFTALSRGSYFLALLTIDIGKKG